MAVVSSLYGWWCCVVGCRMWLFTSKMLLRMSVNMWLSLRVVRMVLMAMSIALILILPNYMVC